MSLETTSKIISSRTAWNKGTTEKFVADCIKVHGNFFLYHKTVYVSAHDKVTITCPIHGDFDQIALHHKKGSGCPSCSRRKRKTTESFIEEAMAVHDNFYTYGKTKYTNIQSKIIITCPKHGDFEQTAKAHLKQHQGCPKCAMGRKTSSQEIQWILSLNNPNLIQQHKISLTDNSKSFIVDAYDPTTNTVYLYHGDFWHGNINRYPRSKINSVKNKTMGELYDGTMSYEKQIRDLGYSIVSIWESDWLNLSTSSKTKLV